MYVLSNPCGILTVFNWCLTLDYIHIDSPISRYCFRLMRDWKLENLPNGKEIFRRSVPNGNRRVPLKLLHNFRMEFPESYLTIWLQTEISGFFGQMVSTQYFLLYIVLTFRDPTLTASFGRRAVSLVVSRVLCLSPQSVMLLRAEASWVSSVSVVGYPPPTAKSPLGGLATVPCF